ncbi:2-C-methyl-D-erythritol 2,4-cyclodiphosphate synthase [bacterium]|nr:2-C-methyl-D-erythritol 2,4-cyclodiphosphate synthase [bacterium]
MRIGIGYDIHPLTAGRKLVLGGIEIEHEKGLLGHSDADVLIHSVCDALLGAAALGDIGLHFPSRDDAYKDEASTNFLRAVAALLRRNGKEIENIDSVIIAQRPRLSPFFDRMRETIAATAGIHIERVNIKAKSPEGIGSIGKGEAIAAYSVALLTDLPKE